MEDPGDTKRFYGLYIVGACFFTLFYCWGMVLNAFPVFVKPITEDMGWTRTALAIGGVAGAVMSILVYPIAGKLIDRLGVRMVMIAGAIFVGVSLLAGSRITQLWQIYLMNAGIGIGLPCATIVPCSYVISNWFVARRGTAMGITMLGTAVGGMVMSPIANWIIHTFSWRVAFVFAGAQIILIVIPIVFFVIRTRPSDMGLEPYRDSTVAADAEGEGWGVEVSDIFSLPVFWQISFIILMIGFATSGLGFHCVAYLDDLGHSSQRASYAWGLVMGVMIVGKLAAGPVADRWGAKKTSAVVCIIFSVSIVILTFAGAYSIALIFAVVYGFAIGFPLVLNPLLAGDYLGMKNFGAVFGILNVMGTIGGNLGPITAGIYFDKTGNYVPIFYLFTGLMLLTAFCALTMKPISDHSRAAGYSDNSSVGSIE